MLSTDGVKHAQPLSPNFFLVFLRFANAEVVLSGHLSGHYTVPIFYTPIYGKCYDDNAKHHTDSDHHTMNYRSWESTNDLDTDSISLLTRNRAVVEAYVAARVAPCISSPGAHIKWFPASARAHGHGISVIDFLGAFDLANVIAEGTAHSCRPVVGVPEGRAADGVPRIIVEHLRDEGLARKGHRRVSGFPVSGANC